MDNTRYVVESRNKNRPGWGTEGTHALTASDATALRDRLQTLPHVLDVRIVPLESSRPAAEQYPEPPTDPALDTECEGCS